MGKARLLVVEDDHDIGTMLKIYFEAKGFEVNHASHGSDALEKTRQGMPNLIILDIMLPGIDGLSILQSIRLEDERLPILILSAKGDPDDRIKGLAFGVDDYLAKPFNLEELLLRIERLLKRGGWNQDNDLSSGPTLEHYHFGDNHIDFTTNTAQCSLGDISLTEQESKVLKLFIANRGKPLSREKLLQIGWGYSRKTTTRTVDNFIVRFRKYFEPDPKAPIYFKSLRSIGYLFDHPSD